MTEGYGNFGKHTLLTGAGWSRNWGGQLANEIWESLIGDSRVQANSKLRTLLLEESAFETALSRALKPPFEISDYQELEAATLDAFAAMDRAIANPTGPWINIYGVQKLLFRFARNENQVRDTGFIFTTNQDLFFERRLMNEHVHNAPAPVLPGIRAPAGVHLFSTNIGAYSNALNMSPIEGDTFPLARQTNIIKLHGSFNWRTADDRRLLVIGTDKTLRISSLPHLARYGEIFHRVLAAGNMRLMIVGYGFGDEHINEVIADSITKHGLRVFVWNTATDVKDRIMKAPHGSIIWSGLLGVASRPMLEVFPTDQSETEEIRRIVRTFFA